MIKYSRLSVINRYNPSHEETITEQHGSKTKSKTITVMHYLCKRDDELKVITENAGDWCIVVIVENKKGERFSMRWDDLYDKEFNWDNI